MGMALSRARLDSMIFSGLPCGCTVNPIVSSADRNMRYASLEVIVLGARMVTLRLGMLDGTMNGRHSIGEMVLSMVIRSTSPRSSHLNFLPAGYFLQSVASFSPG